MTILSVIVGIVLLALPIWAGLRDPELRRLIRVFTGLEEE